MDTGVEIAFADGRYRFWLALPHIVELERKCGNKSVFAIYDEIGAGLGVNGETPVYLGGSTAMVTDIRETIRLGLIGGNSGMVDGEEVEIGPNRARELIDTYAFPHRPLLEGMHVAWAILHTAIHGIALKKSPEDADDQSPNLSEKVS